MSRIHCPSAVTALKGVPVPAAITRHFPVRSVAGSASRLIFTLNE